MSPTSQLDHIVLQLPLHQLQEPPSWLTSNFTISPGGTHGDGRTTNKLIAFADGTYIELLAFTSDAAREGHWWGDKGYGIIDWALTLPSTADDSTIKPADSGATGFEKIRGRLEGVKGLFATQPAASNLSDWLPGPLRSGSRETPTGERIAWQVAFPAGAVRGAAPFWCFDETPRTRRVPDSAAATTHPSGALGVGSLMIFTRGDSSAEHTGLIDVLNASIPQDGERLDEASWELATPRKIKAHVPCQLFVAGARKGSDEAKSIEEKGRLMVARLTLFTGPQAAERGRILEDVEGAPVSIGFTANK